MRKIKVAIIDDIFDSATIEKNFETGLFVSSIPHGKMCNMVFQKYAQENKEVFLYSFQSSGQQPADISALINVFNKAANTRPDLVIMSAGTTDSLAARAVKPAVKNMLDNDIIMVCACSNKNIITYPASLPGVLGVRNGRSNQLSNGEFLFEHDPFDGININSSVPDSLSGNRTVKNARFMSNSVTTQYIGAIVCEIMSFSIKNSFEYVCHELTKQSKPILWGLDNYKSILQPASIDSNPIIVGITGDNADKLLFAKRLKQLFEKEEYCSCIVGDDIPFSVSELTFPYEKLFANDTVEKQTKRAIIYCSANTDLVFLLLNNSYSEKCADVIVSLNGAARPLDLPVIDISKHIDEYSAVNAVKNKLIEMFT
ncbi:MAG: hypothetical protein LBC56_08140 [Oscillospiraceae bacterium]|jgi:hypothetical protein|nr:hypothetical protein [Oscillospiraceae bacterium]